MRGALAAAGLALTVAGPAGAAVSGYWQSASELQAILGRNELADALRQQPVEAVTRVAPDIWEVRSRDCSLRVTVEKEAVSRPGKQPFRLRLGRASCR